MKAFVMKEVGETGVVDKEQPEPGALDAVIRPRVGLICTSDVHTVHGAIGSRENLTLGHEVVGFVEETGDEVDDFELMESKRDDVIKPLVRFD